MFAMLLLTVLLTGGLLLNAQPTDWPKEIRQSVEAGKLDQAMAIIESWMSAFPRDLDAKAWHARLAGWQGHLSQSAEEYRFLIDQSPGDTDLVIGLARVLNLENKHQQALELLERNCAQTVPPRPDCSAEEARTLALLGRRAGAKAMYQSLLGEDSFAKEARAALDDMREKGRHEVRIGTEADLLSYTKDMSAVSAAINSRWNSQWQTGTTLTEYRRFGKQATGIESTVTYRFPIGAVSVGGGFGGSSGIAPKATASIGYDRGFRYSAGPVRGLEVLYDQKWIWYPGARILTSSPGVLVQLPKTLEWFVGVSAIRIQGGSARGWTPSVQTRLTFPVHRRFRGQALFASGAENFGTVDQILFRSSRVAGGGLIVALRPGQEFRATVQRESIAGGRSLVAIGGSYAVRF